MNRDRCFLIMRSSPEMIHYEEDGLSLPMVGCFRQFIILLRFSAKVNWFALVIAILPHHIGAQSDESLTIDKYLQLRYPTEIRLSPDARWLAYTIREPDFEKSAYQSSLYQFNLESGITERLTPSTDCNSPQWSPDGELLAFLAPTESDSSTNQYRIKSKQIWIKPHPGGKARHISLAPNGIESFVWAPDGKSIAYVTHEVLPESLQLLLREKKRRKNDALIVGQNKIRKQIWLIDVETTINQLLYEGDYGVRDLAFSPDAEAVVFATNQTGEADDVNYDLWLLSLGSKSISQLTTTPDSETNPAFSPEGQYIAFLTYASENAHFAQTEIGMLDLINNRRTRLTEAFDFPISAFQWRHGTNALLFEAAVQTQTHIYQIDISSEEIKQLSPANDPYNAGFSMAADGERFCYLSENGTSLPEIMLCEIENEKITQLTRFSDSLKVYRLGRQRVFRWENPSGIELDGILITPPDYNEALRYPFILALHGGPYGRFKNQFLHSDPLQVISQAGYVIFGPNPHGSEGYGYAFGKSIQHDLGGQDYRDIMSGVEKLIELGIVDSTRMGLMGGSYGGYLVNWIIGHTQRFKAAVSMYGIFSMITDWSNSRFSRWQNDYLGGYYWENPDAYRRHSPATYLMNIETPVLLLHGELDQVTSVCNSREMYQALQALGKPVEFVVYPREGHGIFSEPNHQIDKLERVLSWFNKYLGGGIK
ncbi:S9 family peptidase [candidate division KSB1 bacterium]|nr:S9 family peptidase [candidate division KSB1 bacterium]